MPAILIEKPILLSILSIKKEWPSSLGPRYQFAVHAVNFNRNTYLASSIKIACTLLTFALTTCFLFFNTFIFLERRLRRRKCAERAVRRGLHGDVARPINFSRRPINFSRRRGVKPLL